MRGRDLAPVLDRLFASLERGQLLVLVGAGASRWAGLPSWREAVCALARDLVPALRARFPDVRQRFESPGPDERVPVEALLRIPEAHRALCGEARLVQRLSELFDTSAIDPAELPLQRTLVRLSSFVPAIYTTNFDDLLEKTFAWEGRSCQVVAGPEDLKAWRFDADDGAPAPRFPIYKLHGTLGRPGSLVVSESDFLRRSDLAANPIDLRFCSDVMGRELLLVGYGFNDPNMRWIWAKLRALEVPPVGWFLELGASTDLERATMELDGIVRIDLEAADADRPRELLDFLGALAERAERELAERATPPGAPHGPAVTPPSPR